MSFDPIEDKHAKAILKKACKGKSLTTFRKTFDTTVTSEMTIDNLNIGGVSSQLCARCLALAELVAVGRGHTGKIALPVHAEDWLSSAPAFDDELSAVARAAVDKVRTNSADWAIAEDMGGWPAWTNYCRGLSTRLKKSAKQRKPAAKVEGIDAVIKRLRSKQCQIEKQDGHVIELRCTEEGQLTDADLADIIQLKKLRALLLEEQAITDKGVPQISALKQLQKLSIEGCQVKGRGFSGLKLPRLRELTLGGKGTNIALTNCQQLTGLRVVKLSGDLTDKGLEQIAIAKSLESIDVRCGKLKGTGFKALQGLKKLKHVSAIKGTFSPAGFEALCGIKSLISLELMSAALPLKQLELLGNLKKLESLGLFATGVSDRELKFLSRLRRLKTVDLSRNKGVTDDTVKVLAKLPLLEDLSLWETGITAQSIDALMGMKNLRELSIAQTAISRAAEKRLMKSLQP